MTKKRLSEDEWDEVHFPRPEETEFDAVLMRALSRRGVRKGDVVFGPVALLSKSAGAAWRAERTDGAFTFPFSAISTSVDDDVHLPPGYSYERVVSWGDPLFSQAEGYDVSDGGPLEGSEAIFGENTDGLETFWVDGRQLIAVNHESANLYINLPKAQGGFPQSANDVQKIQNLLGVSIIEVRQDLHRWRVVVDSPYNRRISHRTPMSVRGPAAGHHLLKTSEDPEGMMIRGTTSNCGAGKTPWGTYLTCEENFNGLFGGTEQIFAESQLVLDGYIRYGINDFGSGYEYYRFDERFDVATTPNGPHRYGWVVEIDPSDPNSRPVKRTGLGRFKHENAEVTLTQDSRVVVYMGDDERGEYLYKFVSDAPYIPNETGGELLDRGTLYAARFEDDGTGSWLPLTPQTTGMATQAEILIFARIAGSKVGATTMDRPEWVSVNPAAVECYCCLTNNKDRGVKPNKGGIEAPVNGPNPRKENYYGQIVRWYPDADDHGSDTFTWDIYALAGNPVVHSDAYAGSININESNMFNSPDGLAFDNAGFIWIRTDGNDSNEGLFAGQGNNQMLIGDPITGEIRRFMTGPKGCEVTGLAWSEDRRTAFVGIQHPDRFPDQSDPPRSTLIAIRRDDGAPIG